MKRCPKRNVNPPRCLADAVPFAAIAALQLASFHRKSDAGRAFTASARGAATLPKISDLPVIQTLYQLSTRTFNRDQNPLVRASLAVCSALWFASTSNTFVFAPPVIASNAILCRQDSHIGLPLGDVPVLGRSSQVAHCAMRGR